MTNDPAPRYRRTFIETSDNLWINLGQLRELIQLADERGWPDSSLICHGPGIAHPSRRNIRAARRLIIEGHDPETPPASST